MDEGRTKYNGRLETSFRLCICMKCARKYSDTSSYVFGRSSYDEMLRKITVSHQAAPSHQGARGVDALFSDFDPRLQFLLEQVRLVQHEDERSFREELV